MENHLFTVEESANNKRLDAYLAGLLPDQSRSYIQKLIEDDQVRVNGQVEKQKD